ncbi:hypothetical protein ABEY43_06670 [Priestia megaterium]
MTYTEAKEIKNQLENKNDLNSNVLNSFEKNSMGMTPDHIRATPEYQKTKKEYDLSFAELRNFNGWYVKTFKKEIQADRRKRFTQTK